MNARSQFSYKFLNFITGEDIYNYATSNLFTISNQNFFAFCKDVSTLPPQHCYIFDYRGRFDKFLVPDIIREEPQYIADGEILGVPMGQSFDERDLAILSLRFEGVSFRQIAEKVGLSTSTVHKRWKRMKGIPSVLETLVNAGLA